MTKTEALNKAQAARVAAKQAYERHALYATIFGGIDNLTKAALLEADTASDAANKWDKVAAMHPSERASVIRKQALPAFMFGY